MTRGISVVALGARFDNRQRLEDHPKGALNDLRAMVQELGYDPAYAGRTFGEPVPSARTTSSIPTSANASLLSKTAASI